jgi:hypothetical protein
VTYSGGCGVLELGDAVAVLGSIRGDEGAVIRSHRDRGRSDAVIAVLEDTHIVDTIPKSSSTILRLEC